ncbi:hypothetical protein H5T52_12865, partial [Candidatus Bipolaricaulota bacterium]|nr:hypothetical protein [Candidatus Bipolaricaulota bacterium]
MGVFSIRVIKEIKKILEEDVRKGIGKPFLDVENYNVYDFNREKFRPLLDVESRLMAFIDGG